MIKLKSLFIGVITILFFTLSHSPLYSYHEEWHEGPSCGTCHCTVGQPCWKVGEDCGCGEKPTEPGEG